MVSESVLVCVQRLCRGKSLTVDGIEPSLCGLGFFFLQVEFLAHLLIAFLRAEFGLQAQKFRVTAAELFDDLPRSSIVGGQLLLRRLARMPEFGSCPFIDDEYESVFYHVDRSAPLCG